MSGDKKFKLSIPSFIKILLIFVFGLAILYETGLRKQDKAANEIFLSQLEQTELSVMEFTMRSPIIIVYLKTPEEFISMAEKHGQDTVYKDRTRDDAHPTYYIFNQDMTIAWRYQPELKDFVVREENT